MVTDSERPPCEDDIPAEAQQRAPETKQNTQKLADVLAARVTHWTAEAARRVTSGDSETASIKITVYSGELSHLDDDTPYLVAHVEESADASDIEGWVEG